ncbi:hypothetical protein [Mesomycoplasma hyopneumoniae]|uniref:hypothetical protein n=1 Tax=Mesomycoplasma hyopneumoniae TaxID=2099 RepID=UPI0038573F3D
MQKSPKVEKPLETPVNEKRIKTELTNKQKQEKIIEIPAKQQQIKENRRKN